MRGRPRARRDTRCRSVRGTRNRRRRTDCSASAASFSSSSSSVALLPATLRLIAAAIAPAIAPDGGSVVRSVPARPQEAHLAHAPLVSAGMGREESAQQAKEAQKAKDAANAAKKQVRRKESAACAAADASPQASRDKQWEVGTKDSSGAEADAAKVAEAAARAAAKKAQEAAEGGAAPAAKPKTGGGVVLPKCKACKKPFDPKKGCPC